MAWIRIPGVEGLVFEPDEPVTRKHPCPDCFSCQFCSEARCVECRRRKRSIACGCRAKKRA